MQLNTISKPFSVHVVLVLVQLCFSGWHVIGSLVFREGTNPLIFALYREIYASILMLAYVVVLKLKISIEVPDYLRFCYLGLCSFLNVVLTVVALQYISPSRYAMMQPCIPVLATIVSYSIGLESLNTLKICGIVFAACGAVLIEVLSTRMENEHNVTLGTTLVAVQCIAMANLLVFQKPLVHKYESSLVTFVFYTIGSVLTLLVCVIRADYFTLNDLLLNQKVIPWVGLFYVSVVASLFTYNAIAWAGKHVSPSILTVYCTVQPIGTIFLSVIFLGHGVTGSQLLGGLLVTVGLLLTVYGRQKELIIGSNDEHDPISQNATFAEGYSAMAYEDRHNLDSPPIFVKSTMR